MTKTRIIAAAAILSSLIASPVLARDMHHGRVHHSGMHHSRALPQQGYDQSYNRNDSGFWPADVAAGVVGGAIGTAGMIADGAVNTAGAVAGAPFGDTYAYDNGYNSYTFGNGYGGNYMNSQSYAARNGFVCQPGTWFRGEDGRQHICQ